MAVAALSAGFGWCAPAEAQQADVNRDWRNARVLANRSSLWVQSAHVGPGGMAITWTGWEDKTLHAAFRSYGGRMESPQVLEPDGAESVSLAGSSAGTAIAAWYAAVPGDWEVRIAELKPGAHRFSPPQSLGPGTAGPLVAMNEHGDAAIAYSGTTHDGLEIPWQVRYRPAGGTLGEPEIVTHDLGGIPDLAVGPDGSVLVSYQEQDRLFVRLRRAGQTFGPRHALGKSRRPLGYGYYAEGNVAVGMDAAGDAVAT